MMNDEGEKEKSSLFVNGTPSVSLVVTLPIDKINHNELIT